MDGLDGNRSSKSREISKARENKHNATNERILKRMGTKTGEREKEKRRGKKMKTRTVFHCTLTRLLACLLACCLTSLLLLLLLLNSGSRKESSSALIVHVDKSFNKSTVSLAPSIPFPFLDSRVPRHFFQTGSRGTECVPYQGVLFYVLGRKAIRACCKSSSMTGAFLYAKYKGKYSSLANRWAAENNT